MREHFGITRIANTTGLDRTGIPTFSAIIPESPDLLSVYSGKGTTAAAARCSAVMEAFERQCAARPELPAFECTLERIQETLDLQALGIRSHRPTTRVECVEGLDMLTGDSLAVPLALVQCPWFGKKLFATTSTNGLASGNTLTEAIYHSLCEVIERHTWSMYHARSHLLPRLYLGAGSADVGFAREVVFPTGDAVVDRLAEGACVENLQLRVLYLAEGALPYTMIATIAEPNADPPMTHMGFGTSLSPAHAITRALTEAAQSRVVDIQGAREDVVRADAPDSIMSDHGRRQTQVPSGRWYFDVPCVQIELHSIPDRSSDDLAQDLRAVVAALRDFPVSRIAVVDLSPGDLPLHAVRVIVPELETLLIDGRVGRRMLDLSDPFKVYAAQ